jgi:hypothetical protein
MFGGARSPMLLEAANYADMFSDVARALKQRSPLVDKAIDEARHVLKKNDRVVWYLKLWKVGFVCAMANKLPTGFVQRIVSDYARRAGWSEHEAKTFGWEVFNDSTLMGQFQHYLSLSCPEIQNRTFRHETPDRILHDFAKAEKAWQSEVDESFEDSTAHELIRFPNGLAWFDLKRPTDEQEGRAMGHGGNSHRHGSTDTILSLRHVIDHGNTRLHKPVLTFVLDEHGLLGEMKGKFNGKPERQYHNEIVALLQSPIVHGIKGGGYKAENNFRVEDLDEETRGGLIDAKPELGGLYALYHKYGIHDKRVVATLEERLQAENIRPPMMRVDAHGDITLQIWPDLEKFAEHADDGIVVGIIDILNGDHDHFAVIDDLDDHEVISIISALNPRDYAKLMRTLQVRAVAVTDPQFHRAMSLACQRIRATPFFGILIEAANESLDVTKHHQDIQARLNEYVAADWSFGHTHQWIDVKDSKSKIELKIRAEDLVSMVTAPDDDHDDYIHALHDIRELDWGTIDSHVTAENRREAGLSSEISYDAKHNLESDTFFAELLSESLLNYEHAGATFMKKAGL